MIELSKLLRSVRKQRKENQTQFGALTSVTPSTVSLREHGDNGVPSAELELLARATGLRFTVGPEGWEVIAPPPGAPSNPLRDEPAPIDEQWRTSLPLLGRAAAGDGALVDGEGVTWFPVSAALRRFDGLVKVEGDSMSPLLQDGDLVGLRSYDDYDVGDVVVAQDLRSEAIHIKVWAGLDAELGYAFLNSVNPACAHLRLRVDDLAVLGVAYGLLRLRRLKVA